MFRTKARSLWSWCNIPNLLWTNDHDTELHGWKSNAFGASRWYSLFCLCWNSKD